MEELSVRQLRVLVLALAGALAVTVEATAAPITVHNTGVNASNILVAAGLPTAFWTLLSAPAGATEVVGSNPFAFTHPAYAPNTATSGWVSPAASGNASVGNFSNPALYVYALIINLTGLTPATAAITGNFATDNTGFINVNGGTTVATSSYAGFGSLTSFTMNSGFVAGLNTIQVGVWNQGNPTAFHVQFTSATASPVSSVPEPSSLSLLGFSMVALAAFRRKMATRAAR
jgi:PEP-CTERM motif-containing protein